MSGFALAVKEAAVASGLGTTFLPGVAPSAVDGFAVGTLLSGLCFLLVMAPRRRSRRKRLAARKAVRANARQNPLTPQLSGYVATPTPPYTPALPAPVYAPEPAFTPEPAYAGTAAYAATVSVSDPFADESAEMVVSYPAPEVNIELPDARNAGHSRHRLTGPEAERRPEIRRAAGRHAAPPAGVGSRMTSKRASQGGSPPS